MVLRGARAVRARSTLVERLLPTLLRFEHVQLDELLLSAGLAVTASSWFAWRRWRESAASAGGAARERAREGALRGAARGALGRAAARPRSASATRLAELLHDEVGQTLYACQLKLDALAPALDSPHSPRASIDEARALADAALDQTRALTSELSPPVLHDLGLLSRDRVAAAAARAALRTDRARARHEPAFAAVPPGLHVPVFRSVSELLVNACKHAGASEITLSAERDASGEIRIAVADNGRGFDPEPSRDPGFGLLSVERRMACLHGALELQSSPGHGTTATLRLSTPA